MKRRLVMILSLAAVTAGCGGGSDPDAGGSLSEWPAQADTSKGGIIFAKVGNRTIPAMAVVKQLEEMMGPDRAKEAALNPDRVQVALAALVDQYVWAESAVDHGYRLTPQEQVEVDGLATRLLATRYVGDLMNSKTTPSREMVENWYKDNQENYLTPVSVGLRHILVATQAEAENLRKQVTDGTNFADLARKYSLDDVTRDIGGALGMVKGGDKILGFDADGRSTKFENAALPLEAGEMTIVETRRGWHLIRCEKRDGGGLKPLEEVYDDIATAMARRDFSRVYNEELFLAREQAGAEINAEGIEAFTGVTNNIERILEMAEAHPDPGGRIELYRRIVFDFPNSEHAAYSQFMIAYLNLVELNDSYTARKALAQLARKYDKNEWAKAGAYLGQFLDPNMTEPGSGHRHKHEGDEPAPVPLDLGSPEDVLRKANEGK